MRVLDLDLDFFLTDVCALAQPSCRPAPEEAAPWPERDVRAFLEENCGLSRGNPVPGRVFETHDGALWFWRDKLRSGALAAPFSVDHIDAHSDLAGGPPGPAFVLDRVLARRPENRADLEGFSAMRKLDEGNYLLFALAFGWISGLTNVRNPRSRPDIPPEVAHRDAAGNWESIRLSCPLARLLPQYDFHEPEIPFRVVGNFREYRAHTQFDFATLALSPRYAPARADCVAEIFREYICPV